MKIIILNGSPRKSGASATILKFVQAELMNHSGVETEFINIDELNIAYCKGCSLCFKTGSCFLKDDADEAAQKLADADGIIVASPTYESNISGQLKTFFDRGHFIMEQRLNKKTAMLFTVGENYGINKSLAILSDVFLFSGAQISFKKWYKMPFTSKYILTEKMQKSIGKRTNIFIKTILSNRVILKDRFMNFAAFHIGIKPFVISRKSHFFCYNVINK